MCEQEVTKAFYPSDLDHSMQPALIHAARGTEKRPLAVCLHTWSGGIDNCYLEYTAECAQRNWHMIFPYFRGPNWTPEACG